MSYRDNVNNAAAALQRGEEANWDLARLTFESTYDSGDYSAQTERVPMAQWCADVEAASGRRFSVGSGRRYKTLWRQYGPLSPGERGSWIEAFSAVSGHGDEAISERMAGYVGNRLEVAPAEKKRELFQQLARDPEVVAEAAVLGTPTSRAVAELHTRTERVREEHREREVSGDPIAERIEQVGAALDLEAACTRYARDLLTLSERFAREINDALPRTGAAREEHLYWVRQAIGRARSVLDGLEGYAETGRTDLDVFLQDVLGGR